jgi:hypothetical protein
MAVSMSFPVPESAKSVASTVKHVKGQCNIVDKVCTTCGTDFKDPQGLVQIRKVPKAMSTTKATREQANEVKEQLENHFKGQAFFKKAVLSDDDHGACVDLHIDKTAMEAAGYKIPHQTVVKISVFNRN